MRRVLLIVLTAAWLATLPALAGQSPDPKQVEADEQKLKSAKLDTDGKALLEFLRARTLTDDERAKVDILIAQLGAIPFRTREQATMELIAKGPIVRELLKQNLDHPDPEIGRRCKTCLDKILQNDYRPEVPLAVVRLLAVRKPAGAVETLLAFLPFADTEELADESRAALVKLAAQDPQAHKTLAAALTDKEPVRRAAAGVALARAAAEQHKQELHALLKDKDATVRWRVGTALALVKDKAAVPALIDTLPDTTQSQAWQTEDLLIQLAKGKPPAPLGRTADSRALCRDAWHKWWKENADKVDLAVLKEAGRLLGYTTVVLLDRGRVQEVDGNNNVRWQIDNLEFPLDVQVLAGDKVLIAEFQGNVVTERDFKGNVLWKHGFDGPQMAQRLANGNTFIGGRYQLLEVDPGGKQTFAYNPAPGVGILKCSKLPNGDVVAMLDNASVVRLDGKGNQVSSFRISLDTKLFGGRIQGLPNSHVLIPHHGENKVAEYDAEGKMVWHVDVQQPIAAVRLPNGNTIVTSMSQNRAVEFDQSKMEVWEFRDKTRVTRAVRR